MKVRGMFLTIFSAIMLSSFAQGSIEGNLKDEKGVPLSFANVIVFQDNEIKTGVSSDIDGFYFIDGLREGIYEVQISYMGSKSEKHKIKVVDRETFVYNTDVTLGLTTGTIIVTAPKSRNPIIDKFDPTSHYVDDKFITEESRIKNIPDLIKVSSPITEDKDGNISFRGSRPGQGAFYVDGMRLDGSLDIPTAAIYSMKIYNGGVPAAFGNTTSAVVVIETKSYFNMFE